MGAAQGGWSMTGSSITPSMPWNTLEPSLQAATVLGQRTSSGTFCTICQECDHSANQCALAPLQQQVRGSGGFPVSTQNRPPRRPESLARICVSWNKGRCTVSGCTYRHICAGCHRDHKARVCPDIFHSLRSTNRRQSLPRTRLHQEIPLPANEGSIVNMDNHHLLSLCHSASCRVILYNHATIA